MPGNSCMNYLIFITNNLYNSFDKGHEEVIKGSFLDISKSKLKQNGITGELLNVIADFLNKAVRCPKWSKFFMDMF